MAITTGTQIGPYVVEQPLGSGGMATVYKAVHPQLNRVVAIKIMHANFLEDKSFVARFEREAMIVARLNHPNIVPVYDYSKHNDLPYLVMKYIKGRTLKDRVLEENITVDEIVDLMAAIADGLTYAHNQGILHRDIKPSNILVDDNDTPFITDFGLARIAEAGESTMSVDMLLGTPHYISPEQAKGLKELDGRTDIYSLGVVLYELLVGAVPFTADTPFAIIHAHVTTPPPTPSKVNPEIPDEVEMVIERALSKEPNDRYPTPNAMIAALREAVNATQLTTLNPERRAIAATSVAQVRAEYEQKMQEAGVARPELDPELLAQHSLAVVQEKWYRTSRAWTVGGIASFAMCLVLTFVFLFNISNEINTIVALSDNAAVEVDVIAAPEIPQAFLDAGVRYLTEPYPYYEIPLLDADTLNSLANNFENHELLFLTEGKAQLTNEIGEATRTFMRGINITDSPELYLASVSRIAFEQDIADFGVLLAILSLQTALESSDRFGAFRPQLEVVYSNGLDNESLEFGTETQRLLIATMMNRLNIDNLQESSIMQFALASNRIAEGNETAARLILFRVPPNSPIRAEFNLLEARVEQLAGNQSTARALYEGILNREDPVPPWVLDEARNQLSRITTMEGP